MSHFLDTLQGNGTAGVNVLRSSYERRANLTDLNRYLMGCITLSGFVERAVCSAVEIFGVNYAKLILLEPDGHYYSRMVYSERNGAIENRNNDPISAAQERVLHKIAAFRPALLPCLIDQRFSASERALFSNDKYEYVWLVPLFVGARDIGFLELGKEDDLLEGLYLINSTNAVTFIASLLSGAVFHLRSKGDSSDLPLDLVNSLTRALNISDNESGLHSQKMATLSNQLALRLGRSEKEAQDIYWAALLHDIGKVGVETKILRKPTRLTDDEWKIIKRHPELGAKIVKGLTGLDLITPLILNHHERLDGSGYPRGLKGDQLSIGVRIIGVADSFSAMVEGRIYQPKRKVDEVLNILASESGTKYDALVVDALQQLILDEAIINF